jgi:hypothetical protein
MKRKIMDYLQNRNFKVVRVTKDEFELENGDIYAIQFELDFKPTVEEFQKFLDDSKDLLKELIKKNG